MKPKTSPTSPKASFDHKEAIEKIYKRPEDGIVKPPAKKPNNAVWFLSLAAVFGVIGGILGLLLILAYGSEIPWLQKFDLFSNSSASQLLIRQNNPSASSENQQTATASKLALALVNLYKTKLASDDLAQVYLPDDSLGQGFILTDDGYAVVLKNEVAGQSSLAISVNGQIYPVAEQFADPASDFAFIKVQANNLSSYALTSAQDLSVGQDLVVIKKVENLNLPIFSEISISRLGNSSGGGLGALVQSSDFVENKIFIEQNLDNSFNQSVVFTADEKAVGILRIVNGQSVISPFFNIMAAVNGVLSGQEVLRPYLGVHYVNLTGLNNLPESVAQGQKQGALIYSDDEKSKSSIAAKSPAQKAGLKTGDIILSVDGQNIDQTNELSSLILSKTIGQTITLNIFRNGAEKNVKLTLEQQKF